MAHANASPALRNFHKLLIGAGILFFGAFGAVRLGGGEMKVGVASLIGAAVLTAYGYSFMRRSPPE